MLTAARTYINETPAEIESNSMILELADIRIHPERAMAFEANVQRALTTIFPKAKGFLGSELKRGIESPTRYVLLLKWETLENHTVDFRSSPLFAEWRSLVGEFFASPPSVEHFETIA
jgi:heme-degrading monooxygenase HmoA